MEPWLKKILRLIEQTDDRLIVTDPEGKDVFVAMSLKNYQEIRGLENQPIDAFVEAPVTPKAPEAQSKGQADLKSLTEEQLLNRINREIADWKGSQSATAAENQPTLDENQDRIQDIGVPRTPESSGTKEEKFYFEPVDESR